MKITLLAIGKTATKYIQDGIDVYLKRLSHYIPFELKILPDVKNTRAISADKQKELEEAIFMTAIQSGDVVVLLDERGKEMTSKEFSEYINKKMSVVHKNLIFVIGGPYGFSSGMYERAQDKISLSRMTFSHEMVRLFFVEQIYRGMTILRGEPYHHE